MFKDELKLIREAEEKADQMRRDAKLSAKTKVHDTNLAANKRVEEAFAIEKQQCQEIIAEGQAIAQKLYDDILEQAESTCIELEAQAEKQQMEAIKFITERIVGSSVDC